jgi:hypothetical protein
MSDPMSRTVRQSCFVAVIAKQFPKLAGDANGLPRDDRKNASLPIGDASTIAANSAGYGNAISKYLRDCGLARNDD